MTGTTGEGNRPTTGEGDRPAAAEGSRLTAWQLKTVLTVLLTGQLLSALDQTIVGTTLPTMVGRLGGLNDLSLVVTAYLLTSTVATALYGKLADLLGPKPVYLASIAIFTAGSLLVGLSQNMTQMVIFRAVQGAGAGGLVVLAFTISATVVPPRQLGRIQGLVGAMYALASLVGPLIGGAFTQYVSWRWCFLINVPIGVGALLAVAALLKLPARRRDHSVDYLGGVLLTTGVAILLLVTVWGGAKYAWDSPLIVGLLVASLVLTALFVVRERYAAEPIVPLRLFRKPDIGLAMAVTFVTGIAMFGAYVFLPIYLQVVRGNGPTAGGLHLLPLMIAVMIGSGASGWLISAVLGRMKLVVMLGTGIMTVSLFLFSRLSPGTPAWMLWSAEVIMGIGMGMVVSKLIISVQNSAGQEQIGTITAQAAFFRIIGASIGTAAFGAVLNARLEYWRGRLLSAEVLNRVPNGARVIYQDPASIKRLATTAPDAYAHVIDVFSRSLQTVFLVATPIMFLGFALTWFLPDRQLRGAERRRPSGSVQETQQPEGMHTP